MSTSPGLNSKGANSHVCVNGLKTWFQTWFPLQGSISDGLSFGHILSKKKRMNLWVCGIPYIVYGLFYALCSRIRPSPGFNSIFRSTTFSRLFCVWRPESASLNFNKRCWRNILPLCWLFSRTLSIDVNLFTFCTHFLSNQLLDIDFEVVISLHQSYVFNLNILPLK